MLGRLVTRKPLLLTFDDGPEDAATDRSILATLRKHHAKSLWMVTCKTLDPSMDFNAGEHQAVLREIAAQGHQIGNHGYSHIDLRTLSPSVLQHEIVDCSHLVTSLSGITPRYFRPPWGRYSPAVAAAAKVEGMSLVLWTSNSYDSLLARFKTQPESFVPFVAAHPIYDVPSKAVAGDVLLLHDYPNTAFALDGMLTRLEQQGFQFVVPN